MALRNGEKPRQTLSGLNDGHLAMPTQTALCLPSPPPPRPGAGRTGSSVGLEAELLPRMLLFTIRSYFPGLWAQHGGDGLEQQLPRGDEAGWHPLYRDWLVEVRAEVLALCVLGWVGLGGGSQAAAQSLSMRSRRRCGPSRRWRSQTLSAGLCAAAVPPLSLVSAVRWVARAMCAQVARRTGSLVAAWQSVGWVHGVLNTGARCLGPPTPGPHPPHGLFAAPHVGSHAHAAAPSAHSAAVPYLCSRSTRRRGPSPDNMSIVGVTIDYGPFQFMDHFDPEHVSNGSDDGAFYNFRQVQR